MAGHSQSCNSLYYNGMEVIDNGMASSDNSINVANADDTLSTTSYPATTDSCGNSWSETISQSTTMDFSTSVFDMNNISNNISLVSIWETRSSSIRPNHTYPGPCVLTKDYDDNYESPYSIMNSYPTTAREDMFPAYQSIFSDDEKDDFKKESIRWCDRDNVCNFPGHDVQQHPRLSDCRRANIIMCSKIDKFPIGGRLCSKHRKMFYSKTDSEMYSHPSCDTFGSAYEVEDTREHMNNILNVAGLSPVKSQTTKTLKQQSKGSVRRLLSKLKRGTQLLQSKLAESLAPDEGDDLLRMANLSEISTQPNIDMQVENNEMVENIKKIYNLYIAQKMPFAEQVCLLILLPRA
ncbi:unnamed protein product [Rotaria sp. Silwood2]|nr:unnamed protein product [Rotaria sp. Silwood2]